jgi:hypothetical protein
VVDALAAADAREDRILLADAIRRDHERDGPAQCLGGRIAEQLFGAAVPRRDDAVEILADDGVFGRLDDRCESQRGIWRGIRHRCLEILAAARHSRSTAS